VNARLVRLGARRDPSLLPRRDVAAPPPPKVVEVPGAKPLAIKARDPSAPRAPAKPRPDSKSRLLDLFAKVDAKAASEPPPGDPEGDPEGDANGAEEGERYFGLILAKARRNYGVTKTIPPQELIRLKAVVVLYISPTGELLKDPEIQVSSGNEQFDQDVLLALRKAAPFGPPPKNLVETVGTVGVAIEARP
jgi:TonB family protein